jgi:hypothetical protein
MDSAKGANSARRRMGAPSPKHAGIPPVHFDKLSCTACHSGPWPGSETRRLKNRLSHGLDEHNSNKAADALPHIYYPVFARMEDGKLSSYRAVWPAATIVANQVARLTKLLTLTTAQQTQASTIFTNALTAITPLQTSEVAARQALPAAVKSNATATIDQLSTTIGSLEGQIMSIQNKADAAFYAILTADQQTKLGQTNFLNGPGLGPGGPGFGGPGFDGPGPH